MQSIVRDTVAQGIGVHVLFLGVTFDIVLLFSRWYRKRSRIPDVTSSEEDIVPSSDVTSTEATGSEEDSI